MNRRNFLNILGGGTILATVGSAGFLFSRTPTKALEPWIDATTHTDPIQRALAHALLAPNPHNRQPWLVDLSLEGQVTIHRDTTRDLPMTDPFNRQIFIGMGCFLETLKISATETGHSVDFDVLPQGENGPIAIAKFSEGATLDPLAQFITTRHSDKEAYADQDIEADKISELSNYVTIIADHERVDALRQITWDALEIEMLTPRTLKESVDLMRIGKREINANPDGIEMREPMLDALYNFGLLTREMLLDTDHSGFRNKMNAMQHTCFATPAFAVLTTQGNTRHDQISAGRDWMRYSLAVTALGLGTHPMSQALQEYPEVTTQYDQVHQLLAKDGETVQMLARVGYGSNAIATPRWALETRIVNG